LHDVIQSAESLLSRRGSRSLLCRRLLSVGIGFAVALILYVAFFGGVEFRAFGLTVKCRNLSNPIIILIVLSFLRFAIGAGLRNSMVVFVSLLVSSLFGEILLRSLRPEIALPSLKQTTEPSSDLGYRMIPGLRGRDLQTNSHGLRDTDRPWAKPSGVKRVLGIGDSFTYGYRVKLEECYLKQLENRLNGSGEKWDVINAGVSGYNMWQYLAYFENHGHRYEPDLVILGIFFDDFKGDSPARRQDFSARRNGFWGTFRILNVFKNSIEILSQKMRFLNISWVRSIEKRKKYILGSTDGSILTGDAEPQLYQRFERRLEKMQSVVTERHSSLLVMFIPDIIQLNRPELQVVNRKIKRMCERCGVRLLDLTPVFESKADVEALYMLPYDAHTSAEGHRIMSEELEKAIRGMS
jgi:lysophospholipase L1-like esterase